MRTIIVVDYDPRWLEEFAQEKERIVAALDVLMSQVVAIEHVGSTAVPGCAAKPIIDISVGVREQRLGEECVQPLESLGYEYKGEQGIPGRFYFGKGNPRTHHIHLGQSGSAFLRKHIAFRDLLRQRPDLVQQYSALKRRLASAYTSSGIDYTFAKSPFIEATLAYGRGVTEGEALVIVDYDHEWPMYFDLEKAAILEALGGAASSVVAIEHIGSTSVPGLAGKPIIDIAIGVADLEAGRQLVPSLEAIGYEYEGDREVEDADDELYLHKGEPHTHHLHFMRHSGRPWRRDIAFRELLRADPTVAGRYAELKRELAARFRDDPDRHAYAHAKTPFVEGAIRPWADER